MRELFDSVPTYEMPQTQAYLAIMKAEVCDMEQSLRGPKGVERKKLEIRADPVYWADLVGKLRSVLKKLQSLLKDENLQVKFLNASGKVRKEIFTSIPDGVGTA